MVETVLGIVRKRLIHVPLLLLDSVNNRKIIIHFPNKGAQRIHTSFLTKPSLQTLDGRN